MRLPITHRGTCCMHVSVNLRGEADTHVSAVMHGTCDETSPLDGLL